MAMGSGISVMGKNTDLDANQVGADQALANQLLMRALQQPQTPDKSWTQGAARMAEMLVSAYKSKQAQTKQDTYNKGRQQSMGGLAAALAGGDPRAIAKAISGMNDPQSQMMGLQQMAQMQQGKQTRQNEIDKEDRQHQNKMVEETHKSGLDTTKDITVEKQKNKDDPLKAAQARINTTGDLIARTQDKINTEQDPARKAALQDTLGALQGKLKSDQTILLSTRGHQYSEQQNQLNQGYGSLDAGTSPKDLPGAQKQAMASSGFSPLAPQKAYEVKSSELAAGRENKTLEDLNAQKHAMSSMQTKNDQILQMLEAHPGLRGGKGAETMSELQTALHQYLPGMVPGNEPQQVYNKLLKQGLVDASGIMRGEAGGGFRLTQNELLYVVAKTVPELSTNSAQGVKDIIEVQNVMNEPVRRHNEAAQQIITNQGLDASQKQEALAKLDRAVIQEMQTNTMHWVNSKLAPMGQKIDINPNFDPVKNPINKYQRVQLDQNGNPAGVVDNYNQSSFDVPKDIQAPPSQNMAPPMPKGNEAPPSQMAQQPLPPQPNPTSMPSLIGEAKAAESPQIAPSMANQPPPESMPKVDSQVPNTPMPDSQPPAPDMAQMLQNPPAPMAPTQDPNLLAALLAKKNQNNLNNPDPYSMAFPNGSDNFNNFIGGGY